MHAPVLRVVGRCWHIYDHRRHVEPPKRLCQSTGFSTEKPVVKGGGSLNVIGATIGGWGSVQVIDGSSLSLAQLALPIAVLTNALKYPPRLSGIGSRLKLEVVTVQECPKWSPLTGTISSEYVGPHRTRRPLICVGPWLAYDVGDLPTRPP
eukprot:SAG11_NODE_4121_length_2055_cov_3.667178_2_plen_151_part_00